MDQSAFENTVIQLNGRGLDLDGDTLAYAWTQISGPAVTFSSATEASTMLTLPEVPVRNAEASVLQLRVTDSSGASSTDRVSIDVRSTDYLVFKANKDDFDKLELYRYDPEADMVTKLSGSLVTGGDVSAWSLSPDGRWIAYLADQETDGVVELFVAAIDGSGTNKVSATLPVSGDVNEFAWSPDSSQVAYTADAEQDFIVEIYAVDPDGANHRKVSTPVSNPATVSMLRPSWSPDGRYLAYMVRSAVAGVIGIDTHDTQSAGASNTRVNPTPVANGVLRSFNWSPDSLRIAYVAEQNTFDVNDLFTVSPDGSNYSKVNPVLVAGGDVSLFFEWSPDSSRVAYIADQDAGPDV